MRSCAHCGTRMNRPGSGMCCRCGQKVCADHFENGFGESLCTKCAHDAREAERKAVLACFDNTCPICEKKDTLEVTVQLFRALPRSRNGAVVGTCRDVELGAERKVRCSGCRNEVNESTMNWARKAREAESVGNVQTAMNLYSSLQLFEDVQRLESVCGLTQPQEAEAVPEARGYGLRPLWEDEPVNTKERNRMVAPAVEKVASPEQRRWGQAATVAIAGIAVAVEALAFMAMVSLPVLIVISAAALGIAELARRFFTHRPIAQVAKEAD